MTRWQRWQGQAGGKQQFKGVALTRTHSCWSPRRLFLPTAGSRTASPSALIAAWSVHSEGLRLPAAAFWLLSKTMSQVQPVQDTASWTRCRYRTYNQKKTFLIFSVFCTTIHDYCIFCGGAVPKWCHIPWTCRHICSANLILMLRSDINDASQPTASLNSIIRFSLH